MLVSTLDLQAVIAAALSDVPSLDSLPDAELLRSLPTRFPVQVAPATRVFLDLHSQALGMSISALSGLILNQVVLASVADTRQKTPTASHTCD